MMVGRALELPPYEPACPLAPGNAVRLLELLRRADGLIVVSAAYHPSIPGFLKNAIDYVKDLREDPLPYLEGRRSVASLCPWSASARIGAPPIWARPFTRCAAGTRPTQSPSVPRTRRSARKRTLLTRNSTNDCGSLQAKWCNSRQCGSLRRPGFRLLSTSRSRVWDL